MSITFLLCLIIHVILSCKGNKYLGLIIPSISLVFSILIMFGFVIFDGMVTNNIIPCLSAFLMLNIPTLFFLAVYFICRKKFAKNNELRKMNIQDLN